MILMFLKENNFTVQQHDWSKFSTTLNISSKGKLKVKAKLLLDQKIIIQVLFGLHTYLLIRFEMPISITWIDSVANIPLKNMRP